MALTSGYLVIYNKNEERFATLYDEFLNFIKEINPDSEEVVYRINDAEAITGLEDDMWEEVLGELTPQERNDAIAYRLENEVLTNAEMSIEEIMEKNDDEQNPGYNG
ncbi:MAG: hypothetical protein H7Z18_12395 [Methylophilaceae bacterium]|nr:hypothetical protein [Methylophilaceae bacterium]